MTTGEILERVLASGGRVISGGPRPRLLVPPDLRPLVEANREALRGEVQRFLLRAPSVVPLLADLATAPAVRLSRLLDAWSGMDESKWTEANVAALYQDIMDVFKAYPAEADVWYRTWRREHPAAWLA